MQKVTFQTEKDFNDSKYPLSSLLRIVISQHKQGKCNYLKLITVRIKPKCLVLVTWCKKTEHSVVLKFLFFPPIFRGFVQNFIWRKCFIECNFFLSQSRQPLFQRQHFCSCDFDEVLTHNSVTEIIHVKGHHTTIHFCHV